MKEKQKKLYKIEDGIKLPPPSIRPGKGVSLAALTMAEMKVGQSFLVRDVDEAPRADKAMRDFMWRERRNKGKRKFSSRRMKQGVRIWRVA